MLMDKVTAGEATGDPSLTTTERKSDRELVITRQFEAPATQVFEAWTRSERLMRWWVPKSCGITFISCDVDARTGGTYRFVFSHPAFDSAMAFFGRYLEVTTPSRVSWTNDEAGDAGSVTTVTFEQRDAGTLVVMHEHYPSKEALDDAIASGSTSGFSEAFGQLDGLLAGSPV